MSGTDPGDRRRPLVPVLDGGEELGGGRVGQRPDLHHPGPVLPVAIGDLEQDRRAQGGAVADA